MRVKRFLSVMLAGTLYATGVPVFASGLEGYTIPQNTIATETAIESSAMNWFFEQSRDMTMNSTNMVNWMTNVTLLRNMNASLNSSPTTASEQFADTYNDLSGADTTINRQPMFDMGNISAAFDTGALNLQFDALTSSMTENYEEMLPTGTASNTMQLFQNNFGEYTNGLSLETPMIPDGFNPANMLNTMQNSISATYSQAMSSGNFKTVKDSISIGNVFARANQGLNSSLTDGLMSSDSIGQLLSSYSASAKSTIGAEYDLSRAGTYDFGVTAKNNAVKNAKAAFDSLGMSYAFFTEGGNLKDPEIIISENFTTKEDKATQKNNQHREDLIAQYKRGEITGAELAATINERPYAAKNETMGIGEFLSSIQTGQVGSAGMTSSQEISKKVNSVINKDESKKTTGSQPQNTYTETLTWPEHLDLNPV